MFSACCASRKVRWQPAANSVIGSRSPLQPRDLALVYSAYVGEPDKAYEIMKAAWEEFGDLEETSAGVRMMFQYARSYTRRDRPEEGIAWIERLIPIAERLDLVEDLVGALLMKGAILIQIGRPREGMLLSRGGHAMALANGYWEHEVNARTGLTFREQWNEPYAGLEMAREGLEIAKRSGSAVYGFQMVGNGVSCAIRVGEWDWAAGLLEDWIPSDATSLEQLRQYAEFFVDRAILKALRGTDPSADIEQAAAIRVGLTDPQYESYEEWARAWAAFSAGQFARGAPACSCLDQERRLLRRNVRSPRGARIALGARSQRVPARPSQRSIECWYAARRLGSIRRRSRQVLLRSRVATRKR